MSDRGGVSSVVVRYQPGVVSALLYQVSDRGGIFCCSQTSDRDGISSALVRYQTEVALVLPWGAIGPLKSGNSQGR
jgi:hypothetical protein